jgi:RNA polymerase sigma-70 factor, ECF subfamily
VGGGASDAELVVAARQGQVQAFSTLVERHWGRLVRLARTVVGDADAEDLVQDSLVTAWDKLGALREPGSFLPWMLRTVARASVRRARRRAWLVPLVAVPEPADPRSERRAGEVEVERALAMLAPRQRAVMHLTVVEGMSDSEIGGVLGIDAASVRSHRRRARERLQPVLGPAAGR